MTHLQDTRSQATAHNRFRGLRAFFNFCADGGDERSLRREPLGIVETSPMRRMRPPKLDDTPVPLLTPEEVDSLWQATERPGRDFTRRRNAAIIRMFLATGVRANEMASLRLSDVDLKTQLLTIAGKSHTRPGAGRRRTIRPGAGRVTCSGGELLMSRNGRSIKKAKRDSRREEQRLPIARPKLVWDARTNTWVWVGPPDG